MSKCSNSDTDKDSMTNTHNQLENVTDSSASIPQNGDPEQGEIFRSMKINDASKTPYSDATQVRKSSPNKQINLELFI